MMNTKNLFLTAMLATVLTAMMTISCSTNDNPVSIPNPTDIPSVGDMDGMSNKTFIEKIDWSYVTDPQLPSILFNDNGSAAGTPQGIAITVTRNTGVLWQPQAQVLESRSDLIKGHHYLVVITALFPCDGQLQVSLGDKDTNSQYVVPVASTGDFQVIRVEFPEFAGNTSGFQVLFQCGDFLGTTIVNNVIVYDLIFPDWYKELKEDLDNARILLKSGRDNSHVELWMLEDLEMYITKSEEMIYEHTAGEEEVRHMIEELNWICFEIEEAINISQGSAVPSGIVKGQVTDEFGEAIIGATVKVSGDSQ